jgi:hypothetical protein
MKERPGTGRIECEKRHKVVVICFVFVLRCVCFFFSNVKKYSAVRRSFLVLFFFPLVSIVQLKALLALKDRSAAIF